jgi:hypothetical protein
MRRRIHACRVKVPSIVPLHRKALGLWLLRRSRKASHTHTHTHAHTHAHSHSQGKAYGGGIVFYLFNGGERKVSGSDPGEFFSQRPLYIVVNTLGH